MRITLKRTKRTRGTYNFQFDRCGGCSNEHVQVVVHRLLSCAIVGYNKRHIYLFWRLQDEIPVAGRMVVDLVYPIRFYML